MSVRNSLSTQKVKVAKFQFCHDLECAFSSDIHLLVETCETELAPENAVAISYTWGEFFREKRAVGHTKSNDPVLFELGSEWVLQDLIVKLACLTMEHQACWMDQLCIPQEEEMIRLTLASIPTIYRTLPVVALMPGRPCKCLHRELDKLERATPVGNPVQAMQADRALRSCYNSYGINSWFSRIWTRQELMYSSTIRVVWTSDDEPPCVPVRLPGDEGVEAVIRQRNDEADEREMEAAFPHLCPYLQQLFRKSRFETDSYRNAFARWHQAAGSFFNAARLSIGDYTGYGDSSGIGEGHQVLNSLRFLAGIPMRKMDRQLTELERFLSEMGSLSASLRSATHARDYVASVWIDCPGYVLPVKYKAMQLGDLLEDAINQLEQNRGVSPITTVPSGLFEATRATGLWRPSRYLNSTAVTSCYEIYGPLVHPFSAVPLRRAESISFSARLPTPISNRAQPFSEICIGRKTADVFAFTRGVFEQCPSQTFDKYLHARLNRMADEDVDERHMFEGMIIECVLAKRPLSPYKTRSWAPWYPELDMASHVSGMVATLMGFNYEICQKQRMVLVVAVGAPTAIGFMNSRFWKWKNDHPECSGRVHTISLGNKDSHASSPGDVLYEVVQGSNKSGKSTFKVVGVWCPIRRDAVERLLTKSEFSGVESHTLEIV
ncbi:uncharacterized protein F4812DRAFT_97720 [Daldinia caldariorum]|uniref:uncharacterized protein n=1 Tax=Daldinia caldariorum TaxID=326644 RepID=UPI0020075332|nr:uncharacterized protein F4812DRAFT_97720 [Daldinia caldariorum]KAI1466120.1 hypothetical protein F4812DRAFT_97720 [Daldinia caldariorum]